MTSATDTRPQSSGEPLSESDKPARGSMMRWVRTGTILAGLTGVALAAVEAASRDYLHLNALAASCFVVVAVGTAVLCIEQMLAERQEFYRRGQLEGWHRGWNGQLPETDDPLLK
jgi:hypothetical protein